MDNNAYDVIIIGAGPAGSAAAAILAEHGRRVLVLERENSRAITSANRYCPSRTNLLSGWA